MKSSIRKISFVASAALLMCVSTITRSSADTIAYTSSGTETDVAGYGLAGFEFTVSQNINLTQLGFTAIDLGGGDAPHVTLFNANAGLGSLSQIYDTGDIISSVTSYTDNTGIVPVSYVSVGTPILLTTGNTYLVTAPAYWAPNFASSSLTPNPVFATTAFLTTGPGNWSGWPNSGYTFTNLVTPSSSAVGTTPNFQFTIVAVPEPSSYVLLGIGFSILLVVLRRRAASVPL